MSDLIIKLKAKRGELADKMTDMTKNIDQDNWSVDNTSDFDKISSEYDNVDSRISRLEKAENAQNQADRFENVQRAPIESAENVSVYGSNDYELDFRNHVMSRGQTVSNALEIGVDAEGGFIVSESWENALLQYLENESVMRQVSTVQTYATDRNIPISDNNGTAAWIDEEGAYPQNSIAISNKKMQAYKLGNIEKVSDELLRDSFINLRSELGQMFGRSFASAEEQAYTTGNGTLKPTGYTVDAIVGKTTASNSAITYDELIDLMSSVREVYANKGTFMMKGSTAALIRKLKSTDGVPLWQPSIIAGQPATLLGKPLRINESMAAVATTTLSIGFGDFSYYRIADRLGLQLKVLNELYAANGQIGFQFTKRTDGKLLRSEAVKTLKMAV